jgi:hypothetical protein
MKASTVLTVLRDARDFIRLGWTKGTHARRANGAPTSATDPKATCFCLEGALYRAVRNHDLPFDVADDVAQFLSIHTASDYNWLYEWNDAPETTRADVTSLLDRVIHAIETEAQLREEE